MYNLEKSSNSLRDKTREAWISEANKLEDDIAAYITSDVNNLFDWSDNGQNECIFFLVRDGEDYGRAMLKILHAMPLSQQHSWYKLLDISLSPLLSLEGSQQRVEKIEELVDVLAFAILESVGLTIKNDIKKIKIYGRTEIMNQMFTALLTNKSLITMFQEKGMAMFKEGKWLVVEKLL